MTEPTRLWCPYCSAALDIGEQPVVECPSCARPIDVGTASTAAAWWTYAHDLAGYAEQSTQRADRLAAQAKALADASAQAAADARTARDSARAAMRHAQGALAAARAAGAVPVEPRRPLSSRLRTVPASILLQGTGAVLLLAAFIIASAVLWASMASWLQAALLIGLVGAVGLITIWTRRHLPTTSTVLAVLTAAAGVVVGSALPEILPGLQQPWYPVAGCATAAATLLLSGRLGGVRIWWHAGVVATAITGAVGVATLLDAGDVEPGSIPYLAAVTLFSTALGAAALLVSGSAAAGDPETSTTTWWIGLVANVVGASSALSGALSFVGQLPDGTVTGYDRWLLSAAVVALAGLLAATANHVWLYDRGRPVRWLQGACLVLGWVPVILLAPAHMPEAVAVLVAGAVPVATLGLLAWAAAVPWRGSWTRRLAGSAAVGLVGTALLASASYGFPFLGRSDLVWLLVVLWSVGFSGVAWVLGFALRRLTWIVSAVVVAGLTWWAAWSEALVGDAVEWVTLPLGAAVLASWALGARRGLVSGPAADPRIGQSIALVALAPSVMAAWVGHEAGDVVLWRLLVVVAGLALVGAWAIVVRSGWTVPAVGIAVTALGHALVAAEGLSNPPVEAYSVPVAVAVALVLVAGTVDGWIPRSEAVPVGLVVAVVPSWLALIADPGWSTQTGTRLIWVEALLALLVAQVWMRRRWAWLVGTIAAATPVWVYALWAVDRPWVELEALTLPLAVVASLSAALAHRARSAPSAPSARSARSARSAPSAPSAPAWAARAGLWVAAAPSAVVACAMLLPDGRPEAFRLLAVLVVLGTIGILGDRTAPAEAALAASVVVLLAWLLYADWLTGRTGSAPEAMTVPTAAAASLVAGWALRPATARNWWHAIVRWAALVIAAASTVVALTTHVLPSDAWQDWLRVGIVVVFWAGTAYVNWDRPWRSTAFGSIAVIVAAGNVISVLVGGRPDPEIEFWTLPAAAGIGVISALAWRAAGRTGSSLIWVGPPVAMALLPTAAMAWSEGTVGPRAWLGLVGGGAALLLGVRKQWAGLVIPGLLSIGLVVVPILLQWASDLPVWIPLTLVGVVLLVTGARLEAARREGRRVVQWAVQLR